MRNGYEIIHGDALEVLKTLPDNSVQMCCTSPPYFGLRNYDVEGQIGLEPTPQAYVAALVAVFEEVRRVLKKDGLMFLNLGDSYNGSGKGKSGSPHTKQKTNHGSLIARPTRLAELKPKDRIGIPHRVVFALQDAGWWWRDEIVWAKPAPMPESVTDRCTKAHEFIFMLTKNAKYYYDNEAIKEPIKDVSIQRLGRGISDHNKLINGAQGQTPHTLHQPRENRNGITGSLDAKNRRSGATLEHEAAYFGNAPTNLNRCGDPFDGYANKRSVWTVNGELEPKGYAHRGTGDQKLTGHSGNFDSNGDLIGNGYANKRSVWTVNTQGFKEAHFAVFPEKLIEPCILAGSRPGDLVLDPFSGAGTTLLVALKHGRRGIGVELNEKYIAIAERRLREIQVRLFT